MADANVAALQTAVNRFAVAGGFAKVATDGAFGPLTRAGVYSALRWIGRGEDYDGIGPDVEAQGVANGIVINWDETASSSAGLAEFLNGVADDIGIPAGSAPPTSGGGVIPGPVYTAFNPDLLDKFNMLPMWQQAGIGLAGAIMLLYGVKTLKQRKGAKR